RIDVARRDFFHRAGRNAVGGEILLLVGLQLVEAGDALFHRFGIERLRGHGGSSGVVWFCEHYSLRVTACRGGALTQSDRGGGLDRLGGQLFVLMKLSRLPDRPLARLRPSLARS